jgi:hypothetical protein
MPWTGRAVLRARCQNERRGGQMTEINKYQKCQPVVDTNENAQ